MNINYILAIVLGIMAVAEIIIAVLLIAWHTKILEATDAMERYTDLIAKLFQQTRDYEKKLSDRMLIFAQKCDDQNAMYKDLLEIGSGMCNRYLEIREQHEALLNCWKSIEERYSQNYEQFKQCSDKLKELSYQITDLANVSTQDEYELTLKEACDTVCCDCWYDDCTKEECPVWQMSHTVNTVYAGDEKGNDP